MKKALILGITGQDGSYLCELLLEKNYEVHGLIRRSSTSNTQRLTHLLSAQSSRLKIHYGDITDATNLIRLIQEIQPDEIYNLAAQSHVHVSFEAPEYTANTDALGALRVLEAIRILGLHNKTKYYQASTSELYGKVAEVPQRETTPFYPRSPYAAAKLYAYWITVNYREAYNIFACNGILFNHESPRRGETFVTRKITQAVARIVAGDQSSVHLGNLDSQRDWGYAKEYVEAMWLMMQHSKAEDFVIATGKTHTVRSFVEAAFKAAGVALSWEGRGTSERGIDVATGKAVVVVDPQFFRPTEVDLLLGDPTKAKKDLGWEAKMTVEELATLMVQSDIAALAAEKKNPVWGKILGSEKGQEACRM